MYEKILSEYDEEVEVLETPLPQTIKGLYADNTVAINSTLTNSEKSCTLVEELGHHYTSSGDILDQSDISNRKQERTARAWGYEKLVSIEKLIDAYKSGVRNRHELAEYLEVTESFIEEALRYFNEKYGTYYVYGKFIVYFEPLGVLKKF